jgi:ABC-type multidrug transport system ATPase subunit
MWAQGHKDRSIVLTTHSMEEADSLSNRIGILVNGKLAVLGTSQELKSAFGMNYTFEGSVEAGPGMLERAEGMKVLIKQVCPGSIDDGSFDGRVKYTLPQNNFLLSDMFRVFEKNRRKLKLKDYTVSQTTLETVFCHFAQHQM